MDLIIKQNKNNTVKNFTRHMNEEEMCYLKLNVSIGGSLHSGKKSYFNNIIKSSAKTIEVSNKVHSKKNNISASNQKQENNSTEIPSVSDITIFTKFSTLTYKISDPDDEDVETIATIIRQQKDKSVKDNICSKCLDNFNFISDLAKEIQLIKEELKKLSNVSTSKQELIIKFSRYINQVNIIKSDLYQLTNVIKILKDAECANYNQNNDKFNLTIKSANQLVEAIQESIRKQSLNINFVIIS
jgi:hypothetical protein